jgi:hypothetical protein
VSHPGLTSYSSFAMVVMGGEGTQKMPELGYTRRSGRRKVVGMGAGRRKVRYLTARAEVRVVWLPRTYPTKTWGHRSY